MVQATGWDAVYQTRITHGWLPYAVWAMLGVGLVALAAAQIAAGKRRNVVKQAVAALVTRVQAAPSRGSSPTALCCSVWSSAGR